jgi:hypothetical protein
MSDLVQMTYRDVAFDLRDAPSAPALFLFGVRKSGSSIMNSMVAGLLPRSGVHYVDIPGRLFAAGVRVVAWQRDAGLGALLRGGNLYGGFRDAPLGIADHPLLLASAKALLVRDPRDALVSEYFSNAYTHTVPETGGTRALMLEERAAAQRSSIRDYVLRMAPELKRTLDGYLPFLGMSRMRLYKYEDAVMQKRWFLRDIATHFGLGATDAEIEAILGWADVRPAQEDPTKFVRKVTPGDHLEKLDAETIARVNAIFGETLTRMGYAAG